MLESLRPGALPQAPVILDYDWMCANMAVRGTAGDCDEEYWLEGLVGGFAKVRRKHLQLRIFDRAA